MKRREFLAATGGVALSALSSRRVLGRQRPARRGAHRQRPPRPRGDAGVPGDRPRRAARASPTSTTSSASGRARRWASKAPEIVAHEEALARADVDAVLIGVPDHLHLPLTLAALAAGKHVFLEKPTTHVLDEGPRLVAAVRKSGRVCQTGTQQRSGAHYKQAKAEYFDTGKLGKVIFVRAAWSDFPWQRRKIAPQPQPAGLDWARFLGPAKKVPYDWIRYDSWRYFPDYGGGLLADILTHWVDVAQWFLNETRPAERGRQRRHLPAARRPREPRHRQRDPPVRRRVEPPLRVVACSRWRPPRPSVFFQGTEGVLDIARDGYVFRPNKGQPVEQKSTREPRSRPRRRTFSTRSGTAASRAPTSRSASRRAIPSTWPRRRTGAEADALRRGRHRDRGRRVGAAPFGSARGSAHRQRSSSRPGESSPRSRRLSCH